MVDILLTLISYLMCLCIAYTIYDLIDWLKFKREVNKRSDGKRYCHFCEMAYIAPDEDDYVYCPICGRELTFIDDVKEEK